MMLLTKLFLTIGLFLAILGSSLVYSNGMEANDGATYLRRLAADCSFVLCALPVCPEQNLNSGNFCRLFTPPGQCCPQCTCNAADPPPDCSSVQCVAYFCPEGTEPNPSPSKCCATNCVPTNGNNGGQPCGNGKCSAGQECCNDSCGICTAPGDFCTQQICDSE